MAAVARVHVVLVEPKYEGNVGAIALGETPPSQLRAEAEAAAAAAAAAAQQAG